MIPSSHVRRSRSNGITIDELIRFELSAKDRALARYDAIAWRIRTGYLLVLAGMLTVLIGDKQPLPLQYGALARVGMLFVVVSALAFLVDREYLTRQIRLVGALDGLFDEALKRAGVPSEASLDHDRVKGFLCISAERDTNLPEKGLKRALRPLYLLYVTAPIAVYVLVAILFLQSRL